MNDLLKYLKRFNCIDKLVFVYIIVTLCFVIVFYDQIPSAGLHVVARMLFLVFLFSLPYFDKYSSSTLYKFLRIAYPLLFLSFFYTETDALNNVFFSNLDYYVARYDSMIFGFQPSLLFYKTFPFSWFSELMNFGYFSYYFLITVFIVFIFKNDYASFRRITFYIVCSFLIYYLIFIIIPVCGPQYFFEPPHNHIANSGLFRFLVKFAESLGERPTAAFPSSHVGIILILILIAIPKYLKTWLWLVPFFVILSLSTVYIKAHYATDVLGGLISAPLVLWLSKKIYILAEKEITFIKNSEYAKGIDC